MATRFALSSACHCNRNLDLKALYLATARSTGTKRSRRCWALYSSGSDDLRASQEHGESERVVDVSEWLKTVPDESVVEADVHNESNKWEHEQRFVRDTPTGCNRAFTTVLSGSVDDLGLRSSGAGESTAHLQIKGALDPSKTDILSAYSPEQALPDCAGFKEMTVEDLAQLLQASPSARLIDVRTDDEFHGGHVRQATHISLDRLSEAVRAGELDPQEPLAVMCAKGGRSAQACVRLSKVFKFADVTNVKGGIAAWIAADLPVDQADL